MPPVRYHAGGFPPGELDRPKSIPFIRQASASPARYDGTLAAIPNPRVLLAPLTTRGALRWVDPAGGRGNSGPSRGRTPACGRGCPPGVPSVVNRCAALQRRDPSLMLPLATRRGGIAATDATSPGGSDALATEPPRFSCQG